MKKSIAWVTWIFLAGCTLCSCVKPMPQPLETPTETLKPLISYQTPTVTMPVPTITLVDIVPANPLPSATPFFHLVTRGETLLGIALEYGVTLEALQAANPGVDAQFLPVDAQLIIPLGNELGTEIPTPTPVNLDWAAPICYPTGEGGLWCYLLVGNSQATAVENLSAWIGIYDEHGSMITSAVAVGLLNILRPGDAMPLMAYFNPPLPSRLVPRGELLTAVELPAEDTRYLDWQLGDLTVEISSGTSREARIIGILQQPESSAPPSQVWIMAVAYDLAGQVVGVRKIETAGDLDFQMVVYSQGEGIDHVEILAELKP